MNILKGLTARAGAPIMASGLVSALLLFAPPAAPAEAAGIASGVYDDSLMIGFDPATRIVTGYFYGHSGDVDGVVDQFVCAFYLKGKLSGSRSLISTYDPSEPADDLILGELLRTTPRTIRVLLRSEHGGCQNIVEFADKAHPEETTLQAARPWTSIAVVKSKKAYFFDSPGGAGHRKGYVVQDNGVGVRAVRPGWLQVDYVNPDDGKSASGWIRQSDVYPAG